MDENGKATMVSISEKLPTQRFALARSVVQFPEEVINKLKEQGMRTQKGSIFQVATIAGIMAAKQTASLIPLCHPLGMDKCDIDISVVENEVIIICSANIFAKTGVEMEALVGATVASLTVYDMCKSLSHDIVIKETRLLQKTGGKNDYNSK